MPKPAVRDVTEVTPEGILTKKAEVTLNIPIGVKSPNRRELEDAEMRYAVELSNCIKSGILTKNMLSKAYANTGGMFSEDEKKVYDDLYNKFQLKQFEYQSWNYKANMETATRQDKDKFLKVSEEFWDIYNKLQQFENENAQLFNQTAEVIARNKVCLWLAMNMTYIQRNTESIGDEEPKWEHFFRGSTYDDKLDYYERILEEEESFDSKVAEKALIIVSFWYTGRASTQEDFEYIYRSLEGKTSEPTEDAAPVEETPELVEETV
jgi:hypothetical protein